MIEAPEPVSLTPEQIGIPLLSISSESQSALLLELKDIDSDFRQLSAAYGLDTENGFGRWQGEGHLKIHDVTALKPHTLPDNISFSATNHHLVVDNFDYRDISLSALQIDLDASYQPNGAWKAAYQ